MITTRRAPLLALSLLCSLSTVCLGQNLEIHHIDVGQGDSTLIIGPKGRTILIDGGDNTVGRNVVVPYLNAHGVASLDYMIATHMHADHIGGFDEVLAAGFDVGQVLDNGSTHTSNTYSDYVDAVSDYVGSRRAIQPGEVINLGDGARATCVCVDGRTVDNTKKVENRNDRSVCLLLEFADFQYFIGGDIGGGGPDHADVEGFIAPLVGDVDVLRVNHHGSASSTNCCFLATLRPEAAVVSVGKNNYGHPDPEVLERLRGAGCDVMQTGGGDEPYGRVLGHIVIVVKAGKNYWINGSARRKDEFIPSENRPPVAAFTYGANGRTVSFDASASSDESSIQHYFWNFGDETTLSGKGLALPTHTYASYGDYTVFLSVLDPFGISGTTMSTVSLNMAQGIAVTATAFPQYPPKYSYVRISVTVTDLEGEPVAGASVRTVAYYKTTETTKYGSTGADGSCNIDHYIGNATSGYTIWVDVYAGSGSFTASTRTWFTPQ